MNPQILGIALALFSSVTTAVAHAMLKSGKDKLAVRGMIGATGTLVALPACFFVPQPNAELWPWLCLASALHTTYQLALNRSYSMNGFAVAYPWARGIAPPIVALLSFAFLGEHIGVVNLLGVATVSTGLLLIAGFRSIPWAGLAAATVTGILTALYTVVDARGIRLAPEVMTFVVWFFLFDGLIMFPIFALARRGQVIALLAAEGWHGIAAGLFSLVSFGAALIALRLAPVPVVSALRETSVVFAMIIASAAFKEEIGPRRTIGALLSCLGAILVIYRPI